jgi:hypothetical protein
MTWLLWQQQRRLVLLVGVALVAAAVFLGATGVSLENTYRRAIKACSASGHGCFDLSNTQFFGGSRLLDLVIAVGFLVPFVLGLFWGVPLVAREFEEGTHRLAWTQSVSRRHWLGVRLGWFVAAAAVVVAVLSALTTWWYGPINAVQFDRLGSAVFDSQGIAPVGYAIFGVVLGATVGALIRRTVAGMAVTFFVFAIVRYVIAEYLRPHLLSAQTVLVSLTGGGRGAPSASWVLSQTIVNASGRIVPLSNGSPAPGSIPLACRSIVYGKQLGACLDPHGFHYLVTYQPANRFWVLQGIEVAIFVAAAIGLAIFTLWWVAREDA